MPGVVISEIRKFPACPSADLPITSPRVYSRSWTLSPRPIHSKFCLVGPRAVVGVSRAQIRTRCAISEAPQPTSDDAARFIGKMNLQWSIPGPGCGRKVSLGSSVGRDVVRLSTGGCSLGSCHGKRHCVGAGLTIGMVRIPDFTRLAVSKVPEPFGEASGRTVYKMYFQGCFATYYICSKDGCKERCICTHYCPVKN